MLKAGAAITEITPGEGIEMAGYPHCPRPNVGAHDPLFASALYLDNGEKKIVWLTLDILYFGKVYTKQLRDKFPEYFINVTTREERAQAWIEHMQKTSEARAQYQQQAKANEARRQQQDLLKPLKRIGIFFLGFIIVYYAFHFVMLAVGRNVRKGLLSAMPTTTAATTVDVKDIVGIDTDKVVSDEDFMINAVESGRYLIKNEKKLFKNKAGEMAKISGEPEFVESYVLSTNTYAEIHLIFKCTCTFEDDADPVIVYFDAAHDDISLNDQGKVACRYSARFKHEKGANMYGYEDKDKLVKDVIDSKPDIKITKLSIGSSLMNKLNDIG